MHEDPLAYFITFTVYGTFLQGDMRWWRYRGKGSMPAKPRLEHWHRSRLNHDLILLDADQRLAVEQEAARLSDFRDWKLWAINARSNHIHVVISAAGYAGAKVRDQIKANCTRVLRQGWPLFQNRPVWTVGGDLQCINSDNDLERVIFYSTEVQDRKARDQLEQ